MDNNTTTNRASGEPSAHGANAAPPFARTATLKAAGATGSLHAGGGDVYAAKASERTGDGAAAVPPAHRIDPRVSLVCILLIGLSTFVSTSVAVELAAVGGCVLAGIWCGRPSSALRWAAAWAALFVLCWLCAHSGVVLMAMGASFAMLRRMLCAFMMAANMVGTTRTGELAYSLQRLGLPKRVSAALCVMLRFAPTLGQEFGAVLDAMKVRGIALSPARVLRHPVQVVENLLVPVVGRVGIVADELANAAAVRGIDAPNRRTSYYELRIGAADALLLAYFVALAGVSVALGAGVLA